MGWRPPCLVVAASFLFFVFCFLLQGITEVQQTASQGMACAGRAFRGSVPSREGSMRKSRGGDTTAAEGGRAGKVERSSRRRHDGLSAHSIRKLRLRGGKGPAGRTPAGKRQPYMMDPGRVRTAGWNASGSEVESTSPEVTVERGGGYTLWSPADTEVMKRGAVSLGEKGVEQAVNAVEALLKAQLDVTEFKLAVEAGAEAAELARWKVARGRTGTVCAERLIDKECS
jgi:hypothetical protein